jgi:hypothetical protein
MALLLNRTQILGENGPSSIAESPDSTDIVSATRSLGPIHAKLDFDREYVIGNQTELQTHYLDKRSYVYQRLGTAYNS